MSIDNSNSEAFAPGMTGGMPSPIFTEWGTTPIKKVGSTAEEKIEIRIDPAWS